ncbi:hypothetical protein L0222_13905 [bacterium]|nr:hypothetical protein [bacterium]MCI0602084.1 hypothetical protein [bacterium]
MTYKRFSLVACVLFLVLSITAAVLTFVRASAQRGVQRKIGPVEKESRRQAASYTVYETTFRFPYQARASLNMIMTFPFTRNFGFHDKQNSQGFWTPEYTTAHPPNTFRILVIGNGMTCTVNLPLEETYPYLLAGLLNRKCKNFKSEVISLSINGHKMTDEVVKLFAHGQYLNPDLVIFQVVPSDIEFYSYLRFFHVLQREKEHELYTAKQNEVFSDQSLDWKIFSESLAVIKSWSDKNSVPVGFMVFPPIDTGKMGRNFNHYDSRTMSSGPVFQFYPKFVTHIQQNGFPTLDLLVTFREKAGDRYLASSQVFGGLNPYAHRLIAETLMSFLSEQNMFGCDAKIRPGDGNWPKESTLRDMAANDWLKYNVSHVEQLKFYQELHRIYPKNPWITAQLADVNFLLRKREEAYNLYNSMNEMAPGIAVPWYQMAASTRFPKRKVDLMQKMLQTAPDHVQSMQGLASYYTVDKACVLLTRLLEIPVSKEQHKTNKILYEKNQCAQVLSSVK